MVTSHQYKHLVKSASYVAYSDLYEICGSSLLNSFLTAPHNFEARSLE